MTWGKGLCFPPEETHKPAWPRNWAAMWQKGIHATNKPTGPVCVHLKDTWASGEDWQMTGCSDECMPVLAEQIEIDGINYDLVAKVKQATVLKKSSGEYSGSIVIPESVVYEGTAYSVTNIGERAFDGCWGLTSVTIPNSVTSIGWAAFFDCQFLTSVHISDIAAWCNIDFKDAYPNTLHSNPLLYAEHLYLNGEEVKDLVIPNSVTSIGSHAFYYCI